MMAERNCRVDFRYGSLTVNWDAATDVVSLTGPARFVAEGVYEFAK